MFVMTMRYGTGTAMAQFGMGLNNEIAAVRYRDSNTGEWSPWRKLYHEGNIIYSATQPPVVNGAIWLKPI